MSIGKKIKDLRNTTKWTQSQLADKCGLNRNSIYQYENGTTVPKLENLKKIAVAFGDINLVDYFLNEDFNNYLQWLNYNFPQGEESLPDNEDLSSAEFCLVYDFRRLNKNAAPFISEFINELVFMQHSLYPEDYKNITDYLRYLDWKNRQVNNFTSSKDSHLIPQAAHERTDIEVTDEMRKHDDKIMDNF